MAVEGLWCLLLHLKDQASLTVNRPRWAGTGPRTARAELKSQQIQTGADWIRNFKASSVSAETSTWESYSHQLVSCKKLNKAEPLEDAEQLNSQSTFMSYPAEAIL